MVKNVQGGDGYEGTGKEWSLFKRRLILVAKEEWQMN
jgi:hypothetical protein